MQKSIKHILVAGGAGFVGSNLCEFLVSQGNFVIALDNLSTGKKKNIEHLLAHRNFRFVKGDVVNPSRLAGTLPMNWGGTNLNEIYHLASPASPPQYQRNPINTWKANTIGTLNLLELAKKHKAKFLFASTSEVYGDPKEHPQKETYFGNVNPVGIRACYDESKRAGEAVCKDFNRLYNLDIKIVRIFNTYGPKMNKADGRVVSNFINQGLRNQSITIYGNGKQTRSFMYVSDLIFGLTKFMAKRKIGPVNLGNPQEFTISQLAKFVISSTKSKSKIIYKALPADDPKQRKPDISLAKKILNWYPKILLNEGLQKTIDYYRNEL